MAAANQIHGNELLRAPGQTKSFVVFRGVNSIRPFDALPLVEAFNRENRSGLALAPHLAIDALLSSGEKGLPAFPVNTLIAYEEPGTKFGKEVIFSNRASTTVVLATGKYEGVENAALVAVGLTPADIAYAIESKMRTMEEILQARGIGSLLAMNFKSVSEIQLLIPHDRLMLIENFPAESGDYLTHADTLVPCGGKVQPGPETRFLYRMDSSYVGLVVRYGKAANSQQVVTVLGPSTHLGVVAEVPDVDIPKIEPLLGASITPIMESPGSRMEDMLTAFNQEIETFGYGRRREDRIAK